MDPHVGEQLSRAPAWSRLARVVLALVILLGYGAYSLAATPTTTIEAFATTEEVEGRIPEGYWERRFNRFQAEDPMVYADEVAARLQAGEGELKHRTEAIGAGRSLRCDIRLHSDSGREIRRAKVVLVYRPSTGDVQVRTVETDGSGRCGATIEIPAEERGKENVIAVSVYAEGWSASDYAWFVPR